MLRSEILADLGLTDLRQRYLETYINYGGEVQYCAGIDDTIPPVIHLENFEGYRISVEFDWRKVDVSRPASRWYLAPSKGSRKEQPFFLGYSFRRQWQRGFNRNNTTIFDPLTGGNWSWIPLLNAAFKQSNDVFKTQTTVSELREQPEFQLLSPFLLFVGHKYNHAGSFWYKDTIIGRLDYVKRTINLQVNNFKREIEEVVRDAEFKEMVCIPRALVHTRAAKPKMWQSLFDQVPPPPPEEEEASDDEVITNEQMRRVNAAIALEPRLEALSDRQIITELDRRKINEEAFIRFGHVLSGAPRPEVVNAFREFAESNNMIMTGWPQFPVTPTNDGFRAPVRAPENPF